MHLPISAWKETLARLGFRRRRRQDRGDRARQRRPLQMEALEPRQLLAADLMVSAFASDGEQFLVDYQVSGESAQATTVGVYRSSDGQTLDALIGSQQITQGSDLEVGSHQVALEVDFEDVQEDYRLIVVIDAGDENVETDETNNVLVFSGGVFRSGDIVHAHGSDGADTIDVSQPALLKINFNGTTYEYDAGTIAGIHLRTHGDDDEAVAGSGVDISVWAFGGAGADQLIGGGYHDYLAGGAGDDELDGRTGDDTLLGEDGDDNLEGDAGNDTLSGGAGNDTLDGNQDDDTLDGGDGNDTLLGGYGIDILVGGAGNDHLEGNQNDDTLDGGDGNDTLLGGYGDDVISGGAGDDTIEGEQGADLLEGNDGDDYLDGGAGSDVIHGGYGNDHLLGGTNDDQLFGDDGADTLDGQAGSDEVYGGRGDDVVDGGGQSGDVVDGGLGNDLEDGVDDGEPSEGANGPRTSGINDVNVDEDALPSVIDLFASFDDHEDDDSELTYQIIGNTNAGLFDSAEIANGALTLAYAENAFGSSTLTVRATDTSGRFIDADFDVNVAAINDAPTGAIADLNVDDGTTEHDIDLRAAFDDVDNTDEELSFELIGNTNPALFTSAAIVAAQGVLALVLAENQSGSATLTIRATDPGGEETDRSFDVNVTAVNTPPTIGGLTLGPNPAVRGGYLYLRADDVVDDAAGVSVAFYRDRNGDGQFDAGDQLLGVDDDGSDGFLLATSTVDWPLGERTYFAVATDAQQETSNVASALGSIAAVGILDDMQPGYEETGSGWTDGTSTDSFAGGHRQHAAGTGENTARWTFGGLLPLMHEVQVTWSAGAGQATNATFNVYDGETLITTVTVDQTAAPDGMTADGALWKSLADFNVASGTVIVELTDNADGIVVADAVRLIDPEPRIGSLSATPDVVANGASVTLTANDVVDDDGNETLTRVRFYRDRNGNGQLDVTDLHSDTDVLTDDQYLGVDTDGSDGWSLTFDTDDFTNGAERGPQTYFAVAFDDTTPQELASDPVSATNLAAPVLSDESVVNNNTETGATRWDSTVAMADDGSFVVSWQEHRPADFDRYRAQRFDAAGNAVSAPWTITIGAPTFADMTMAGDGSMAFAWTTDNGLRIQRYNADGTLHGAAQDYALPPEATAAYQPTIEMDDDGNIAVVWGHRAPTVVEAYEIVGAWYDADSDTWSSSPFTIASVNASTTRLDLSSQSLSMDDDGNFAVVWTRFPALLGSGDNWENYLQRFSAGGTAAGSATLVNTELVWFTGRLFAPSIDMQDDGTHVVTWAEQRWTGTQTTFAHVYDASGSSISGEVTVDTSNFTPPNGVSSIYNAASFDVDGNFHVVWAEQTFGTDTVEYWSRAIDSAGALQGDPFLLAQSEYASTPFVSIASAGSASAIAYTGLTGDTTNVLLRMLGELPVIEEEEEAEFPIIDNGDSGFEMFGPGWSDTVNNGEGYLGDYDHVYEPVGFNTATWTFTDLADGVYEIFATYTTAPNQAEETPYSIYAEAPDANGVFQTSALLSTLENQRTPPDDLVHANTPWASLGLVTLSGGTLSVELTSTGTGDCWIIADAVMVQERPQVSIAATDAQAHEPGRRDLEGQENTKGTFTVSRTGPTDESLTVFYSLNLESTQAVSFIDFEALIGSVTIEAGQSTGTFDVTPLFDGALEGDETVVVTLDSAPDNQYGVAAAMSEDTVTIVDVTTELTVTNAHNHEDVVCVFCTETVAAGHKDGKTTLSLEGAVGAVGNFMRSLGNIFYQSLQNPHPVIQYNYQLPDYLAVPDTLEVQLTFGGLEQDAVFYDTSGLNPGDVVRIAVQADATSLGTGRYDYTVDITEHRGEETREVSVDGSRELFNRSESEFGNRWFVADLDRIVEQTGGVALIRGNNTAGWYEEDGQGGYLTPDGSFDTLVKNMDGSYTLTDQFGNRHEFDADGLLTERVDANGNATTYAYTDADGDMEVDELATVTDAFGRTTTYAYTSGLISSVTDYAGRVSTFEHTDGRLTKVTEHDPDGAGALAAPVTEFTYSTEGLLIGVEDSLDRDTTINSDFSLRFEDAVNRDGTTWSVVVGDTHGLVDPTSGLGTEGSPAPVVLAGDVIGAHTDERGNTTSFMADRFGYATMRLDALGNQYEFQRDEHGRLIATIEPDPDGAGPLEDLVTSYERDERGNITKVTYADETFATWTYDATFSRVTSYTDEIGRQTLYEIDSNNGNVLSMTQVFGSEVDSEQGSTETDDVTYSYTYTDGTGPTADLPKGLLLTETDPLGRVTTYSYYDDDQAADFGWLESITFATGTADEATIGYEYDAAGNTTAMIDELGHRTEYEYDALDRLIQMTEEDPDDAGPLASPVWTYEYDAQDNLRFMTDPLGNVTEYQYDERDRLVKIIEEDPDTQGGMNNPETTYTYDAAGNLASMTDALGRVTTYEYDALNRLTAVHSPYPELDESIVVDDGDADYAETGAGWTDGASGGHGGDYRQHAAGSGSNTATWTIDGLTSGQQYEVFVAFEANGSHATDAPFTISHGMVTENTVDVDQTVDLSQDATAFEHNGTYYRSLGVFTVTDDTLTVELTDDADGTVVADAVLVTVAAPVLLYAYDNVGNLKQTSDALGNSTSYRYDERHRLVEITEADPDGGGGLVSPVTTYEYDDAGQLVKITDPLGRETSYEYDELGRQTKVTLPDADGNPGTTGDSPIFVYAYDKASNLTSLTDALGNVTTHDYDNRDRLIETTEADPDGGGGLVSPVTEYEYDDAGRLTKVIDPLDRETTYEYDDINRLITLTLPDADGNPGTTGDTPVMTYAYDAVGNELSMTDALGNDIEYEYDNLYRLTKIIEEDPDTQGGMNNPETVFAYDLAGQLLSVTDPLDRVASYEYDGVGRLVQETYPDPDGGGSQTSPVMEYVYDAAHNQIGMSDPLGNVTRYEFDNLYRLTKAIEVDPDTQGGTNNPITSYAYDVASQLLSITDPLDRTTSYEYDDLGRVIEAAYPDPDGVGGQDAPVMSYVYDLMNNELSMTDALGNDTEYEYDNLYRLTRIIEEDPDTQGGMNNPETSYTYDVASQMLTMTDPLSRTTTYEYDDLGRLTTVTSPDPDGGGAGLAPVTTYAYDLSGNLLSGSVKIDGSNSQTTSYGYDNLYRRTSVTDANNDMTDFTFDLVGNLLSFTDPESNQTTYAYDDLDRLISETINVDSTDLTRSYKYDAVGNEISMTDRNGRVTEFAYDNLHRRTAEKWLDGSQQVIEQFDYTYDLAGQMLTAGDGAADYTYVYDDLGRVTSNTHDYASAPDAVFTYAHDLMGNRTSVAAQVGTNDDFENTYVYDNLYRTTRIEQAEQTSGNAVAEKRVDLAYDIASQRDTITRYADLAGTDLVATTDFAFDLAGRLTDLTHAKGMTTLADYDWQYDAAHRVTSFDSSTDGDVDYDYDDRGQITSADYNYQTDETYTYDDNGNRTIAGYSTGDHNRLESDGTYDYEYDDEGNRTRRTHSTNDTVTVYEWDHRNRLISVTEYGSTSDANSETNPTQNVKYEYDVYNRRVGKTVDENGNGTIDRRERFVWDSGNVVVDLQDVDDDGTVEEDEITARYLWGQAVDQLFAQEDVDDILSEGDVLWPLTDNLGTVRDLASYDAGTDTTTVDEHYALDSFGNVTSGDTSKTRYIYTAQELDPDTGLIYYDNRWYDPATGQFVSADPIQDDLNNTYRYVGNSPTNGTDPLGLEIWVNRRTGHSPNLDIKTPEQENMWRDMGYVPHSEAHRYQRDTQPKLDRYIEPESASPAERERRRRQRANPEQGGAAPPFQREGSPPKTEPYKKDPNFDKDIYRPNRWKGPPHHLQEQPNIVRDKETDPGVKSKKLPIEAEIIPDEKLPEAKATDPGTGGRAPYALKDGQIVGVTGSATCVGVVIVTPDYNAVVYHFAPMSNPGYEIRSYRWPNDSWAVLSGGDKLSPESRRAFDLAIAALKERGIEIKGIADDQNVYVWRIGDEVVCALQETHSDPSKEESRLPRP